MKSTYLVILRKVERGYLVDIPGFEINTFGTSFVEATEMARDAIGAAGVDRIVNGEPLPEPITEEAAKARGVDGFIAVVGVDYDQYRNELDNSLVRKNLTIPYGLNVKAERLGLNLSLALREKIEEYLAEEETRENKSKNEQES